MKTTFDWEWKLSAPEKAELHALLHAMLNRALIAQTNAQALVSRPSCPEVAPVGAEVAGREVEAKEANLR
jgi:hypothetical protein